MRMSTDCVEEALPTWSVESHLTVCDEAIEKEAVAACTVVAVPLEAGSLPSVVYVIVATPEPGPSSAAISPATGVVFAQPPGHGWPSQVRELLGAPESTC